MSLSVLVNLCWLVPGVVGGSEEATTGAIRALLESDQSDIELRLAVLRPFLDAHPDLVAAVPHDVLPFDGTNKVLRVGAEQIWLAQLAKRLGSDVVHHAGGVVPLVHPGRVVLTIHDLQPLDMPENFSRQKRLYLRTMLGRSARAADVVCVPSSFTASRVTELLGVPTAKVVEVPWSLASDRWAETPAVTQEGSRRFLLYPAITYPHKRHLLLLEAFALLADSFPDVDLVFTGSVGPVQGEVDSRIVSLGLTDRVRHLGRVPETELDTLYRQAEAVVIPSAYEGFGMPALEAMAKGCPVVASDSGSLSEVVPDDGLVSGDNPESWARAIRELLSLPPRQRAERVRIGTQAARSFTPERTASALAAAYRLSHRDKIRSKES